MIAPIGTGATEPPALPGASPASIRSHYDYPEEFFRLFLGETMCYSAACFDGAASLDDAQVDKLEFHLNAARVTDQATVLDVGCGWGAALLRAVEERGARRAVGLTLSRSQAGSIAARRHPKIEVREEHWAEHVAAERYDSIISVGAIEHFATPEDSEAQRLAIYRSFFERAHAWLTPTGRLSVQCIVRGQESGRPHILAENGTFPQSALPYAWELLSASHPFFEIQALVNGRDDYSRTLASWTRALKDRSAAAADLIGTQSLQAFMKYLRYSAMGFALGRTELVRMSFAPRVNR